MLLLPHIRQQLRVVGLARQQAIQDVLQVLPHIEAMTLRVLTMVISLAARSPDGTFATNTSSPTQGDLPHELLHSVIVDRRTPWLAYVVSASQLLRR